MWYVVEVVRGEGHEVFWDRDTVLWGPFPGHEHAARWVQGRQITEKEGLHRYTIRQLFKAD